MSHVVTTDGYFVVIPSETIDLSAKGNQTQVSLAQDNNPTEEARAHSEKNWGMMLAAMKKFLEE